jgi:hypothetical protein
MSQAGPRETTAGLPKKVDLDTLPGQVSIRHQRHDATIVERAQEAAPRSVHLDGLDAESLS